MPTTPAGGVTMTFQPPLEFIQAQQGLFRHLLEDLTSLWARFVPLIADMERRWFDSQGEGGWPPLAEATLERKRAEGFSALPLRTDDRQGSLYDTLVDPGLAAEPFGDRLVWSTGVPYAHWHQDGGSVAGRPPRRQVIPDPLPVEYRRQFEQATVSWLNEQAALAFGRT
jgi:hypothetical protein